MPNFGAVEQNLGQRSSSRFGTEVHVTNRGMSELYSILSLRQNTICAHPNQYENLEESPENSKQTSGVLQQLHDLYNSSSFRFLFSFALISLTILIFF